MTNFQTSIHFGNRKNEISDKIRSFEKFRSHQNPRQKNWNFSVLYPPFKILTLENLKSDYFPTLKNFYFSGCVHGVKVMIFPGLSTFLWLSIFHSQQEVTTPCHPLSMPHDWYMICIKKNVFHFIKADGKSHFISNLTWCNIVKQPDVNIQQKKTFPFQTRHEVVCNISTG